MADTTPACFLGLCWLCHLIWQDKYCGCRCHMKYVSEAERKARWPDANEPG